MSEDSNTKQHISWDFDRVASCSAIFIALVAMVVAIYEARVTREHQEISVWPSLTSYTTSLAKVGDSYKNFGQYLKNDGIGPAVIKKISFTYDGVEYKNQRDIIKKILPQKKDPIIVTDKEVVRVILPGKKVLLVGTDFTPKEFKEFYEKAQNRVSGEICYCSLYNSCWSLKDNNKAVPVQSCD